jgi:hypothetical protein
MKSIPQTTRWLAPDIGQSDSMQPDAKEPESIDDLSAAYCRAEISGA